MDVALEAVMGTNWSGLQMPDAVTVLVSTELLAELEADWSSPVQIQIRRTPGIGSGYEMIARTHTCLVDIPETDQFTADVQRRARNMIELILGEQDLQLTETEWELAHLGITAGGTQTIALLGELLAERNR